ncbi:hypothetical protein AK812_SmicGene11522 [Symbiodinium microadriaticum]|uniref:Uncharacterized protein n=1 Tax=Symbiodinium microadriaticum TaxID=2951 RepID=A0A1Q9ED32_SYMMI|nr:hypothetical protein AK812_SmicGene11522 [Symbiodinium microadriaticum]
MHMILSLSSCLTELLQLRCTYRQLRSWKARLGERTAVWKDPSSGCACAHDVFTSAGKRSDRPVWPKAWWLE